MLLDSPKTTIARSAPPAGDDVFVRRRGLYERLGKPIFDRLVALALLVLVLPTMAIVALVVWLSLGRPVVLRQARVGLGGVHFTVYKFRTMRPDRRAPRNESFPGADRRMTHKHPDDPRLTPAGRVLRKLSLDELPQLWNVVRGDMSLVGPRPELPMIVARYENWQHRRHAVRPGITGLWQVSVRGEGEMHEHVDVDIDYVERLSFREDLRILLRTLPAALGSRRGW